jgi:hypothetical protein
VVDPTRSPFNATFDGVTDDAAGIAAAIVDVLATGAPLWLPPKRTALCGSSITLSAPLTVFGNGATLKKTANFSAAQLLNITGADVTVRDLIVDGNRGADDVWTLTITGGTPSSGSFKLTFGGGTTATIPWNATATQVQTALAAITGETPDVTYYNVLVEGGPLPSTAITITFVGVLGSQAPGTIGSSTNTLNAGAPALAHTTTGSSSQSSVTDGIRIAAAATATLVNVRSQRHRGLGVRNLGEADFLGGCLADDNNSSVSGSPGGSGIGFYTDVGGVSRFDSSSRATNNADDGFQFAAGCGEGWVLNGSSKRNQQGVRLNGGRGVIGRFRAFDEKAFGLITGAVDDVDLGVFSAINTGRSSCDPAATGILLRGVTNVRWASLTSKGQNGYGVAITALGSAPATALHTPDTKGTPSVGVTGPVSVDGAGLSNSSDPGLHISAGSRFIDIPHAVVKNVSFAVNIGEGYPPMTNSDITLGVVHAIGCAYGAVKVDVGQRVSVGAVFARDTGTRAGNPGLVQFGGHAATGDMTLGGTTLNNLSFAVFDSWAFKAVKVAGAGAAGADLYTYVTSGLTVNDAAGTAVTGAQVTPDCVKGDITNGSTAVANVTPTTNYFHDGMTVRVKDGIAVGTDLITTLNGEPGSSTFTLAVAPSRTATVEITLLPVTDCDVGPIVSSRTGTLTYYDGTAITAPTYGVFFDRLSYNNRASVRRLRDFATAVSQNDGTGNALARPPRSDLLAGEEGLISETFARAEVALSSAPGTQNLFVTRLYLFAGEVVTNVLCHVVTAAVGAQPTLIKLALLDKTQKVLQVTADLKADAKWTSAGTKAFALGAPVTIPTDGLYYVAFLKNGVFGGTDVALLRSGAGNGTALSGGVIPYGFQAGQTDFAAVGGTQAATGGTSASYWFGAS